MANRFEILQTEWLGPEIKRFEIRAERIARKQLAGQFVIVRLHDQGERIPLTIADSDPERGSVTLIVQGVGKTTRLMNSLETGQHLLDVVGPLGNPSEIRHYGNVVVVGGGVGTAIAWPIAKALKEAGNHVITILGARSRERVILEPELSRVSNELYVTTDDGSYGHHGVATDILQELIERQNIDYVLAIGPIPLMERVAGVTRPDKIPTTVSLNSIMVDGTGMCGGCRVQVGGKPRFSCVDGPEFDGHLVDFKVLAQRNAMYHEAESTAMERFERHPEKDQQLVDHSCALAARYPEVFTEKNLLNSE